MSEKLKEVREKIRRRAKQILLGAAITATVIVGAQKTSKKFNFDPEKDYQTMIMKDNKSAKCIQIPEKTFQLDSLNAVEDIASRIPSSIVDRQDKEQVAETVYNNINTLNRMTEGLETSDGFNSVLDKESNTVVSGKNSTYDISVETPNGYSGYWATNLRHNRVYKVMKDNHMLDYSTGAVTR